MQRRQALRRTHERHSCLPKGVYRLLERWDSLAIHASNGMRGGILSSFESYDTRKSIILAVSCVKKT